MAQSIRCPHCGKMYAMKSELAGKQVRCRQCEKAFTVTAAKPPDDGLDEPILLTVAPRSPNLPSSPVAPARPPAPAQSSAFSQPPSTPFRPGSTAYRPRRRTPKVRSGFTEEGFVWFGVILLTLGILGLILPRFGLQFKMFLGAEQATYGNSASCEQARQSMAIGTIMFGIFSGIVMGIGLRKNPAQAIGTPIGMWVVFAIAFFTSPFSDAFSHSGPAPPTASRPPSMLFDPEPEAEPPPPPIDWSRVKRINLPPGAQDPNHPDFYRVNLAELRFDNSWRRQLAAERLAEAEPKQLRDEITKTLESLIHDSEVNVRAASLKAFCRWSTGDTLPTVIRALDDPNFLVQCCALEILGKRKDPRAVEPVVLMLLKSPGVHVEKCLKEMGSMVEDSLLDHLNTSDSTARLFIVRILGAVATEKGIAKLREIAGDDSDFLSAFEARSALKARGEKVADLSRPKGIPRKLPDVPSDRPPEDNKRHEPDKEDLDPNRLDYYERLARQLHSDDFWQRRKAMDLLLAGEPEKAKADTRKQIARAFDAMIEAEHGDDQRKAVRGLALWGGKDSVPTLLRLLNDDNRFLHKVVLQVLGPLQDERAAIPVARLLGDFFDNDNARECLRQMGAAAEEGLLKALYADNPQVCLTALELLADAGTAKSIPTLREGMRSRNRQIREAVKNAIRKIRNREKEQKAKEKEKGEAGSGQDEK